MNLIYFADLNNTFGVFSGGCLVVAHFWKVDDLYMPFLIYNAVDLAKNNLELLLVACTLLSGNSEAQAQVCESFGCSYLEDGENSVKTELLSHLVVRILVFGFSGWFQLIVLLSYIRMRLRN
ncbi:hypothetical protein Ddc_14518 [Ditylenchus destructor]|nr:hypothetical protein Ddc_14518 [Ditylenchus destructor]